MHHRISNLVFGIGSLFLLLSCNIYRPFDTAKSDEANLEEALRCYHEKDYDCAVAAYERLSEGDVRTEKLCAAYLSQAGLTLKVFVSNVNSSLSTMLGGLATALIPWTATRGEAAKKAAETCLAYSQAHSNNTTILLSSVAQIIDCASRLAKADQYGDGGSDCEANHEQATPGKVTDADVDFLCDTDALACPNAISTISKDQLSNAGLTPLKEAFEKFPSALTTKGSAPSIVRTALKLVTGDSR